MYEARPPLARRLFPWMLGTTLVVLATIKASLVVAYYMHLRYEPRWIALIPLGGLALVAVLVAALTATSAHP